MLQARNVRRQRSPVAAAAQQMRIEHNDLQLLPVPAMPPCPAECVQMESDDGNAAQHVCALQR
jgi:hypothetical protein